MQQSTNSRSQEKAVAAELEDEQRLLGTVIRAHLDTCDFTKDKIEPMIARAREQPSYTACPPTLVSFNNISTCSDTFCSTSLTIFRTQNLFVSLLNPTEIAYKTFSHTIK